MPRVNRPWYRRSRRMWYVNVNGRQTPLGITDPDAQDAAEQAFRRLVESVAARIKNAPQTAQEEERTVRQAVASFLADRRGRVAAETLRGYRLALETHLVPAFGDRRAGTLTAVELERWADRPGWSSSTRNGYLGAVQTFLKWCGHPLALRRPPKESRGADAVLSDDQFAAVLAALPDRVRGGRGDLKALLTVLRETGARPQEVAGLTAEAVDWDAGCARLAHHKTRHRGKARVVYFPAAALAVLEAQRAKYRTGALFRTKYGRPYRQKYVIRELLAVSERVGFRVIAYAQRHTFATKALAAGVPDAVVAELLGHTGTAMVAKHYGHLNQRSRELREAVEKVSNRKVG